MILRVSSAGLLGLAALVAIGFSATPAEAQSNRRVTNPPSPNYSYQSGPRTRIFVTRRNWLDLGTEVLPGERKYTDYAIPPAYSQNTIDQLTGRPFTRQPFIDPFDLPGYPKGGYGY